MGLTNPSTIGVWAAWSSSHSPRKCPTMLSRNWTQTVCTNRQEQKVGTSPSQDLFAPPEHWKFHQNRDTDGGPAEESRGIQLALQKDKQKSLHDSHACDDKQTKGTQIVKPMYLGKVEVVWRGEEYAMCQGQMLKTRSNLQCSFYNTTKHKTTTQKEKTKTKTTKKKCSDTTKLFNEEKNRKKKKKKKERKKKDEEACSCHKHRCYCGQQNTMVYCCHQHVSRQKQLDAHMPKTIMVGQNSCMPGAHTARQSWLMWRSDDLTFFSDSDMFGT